MLLEHLMVEEQYLLEGIIGDTTALFNASRWNNILSLNRFGNYAS